MNLTTGNKNGQIREIRVSHKAAKPTLGGGKKKEEI
jgi:hypothetical protein